MACRPVAEESVARTLCSAGRTVALAPVRVQYAEAVLARWAVWRSTKSVTAAGEGGSGRGRASRARWTGAGVVGRRSRVEARSGEEGSWWVRGGLVGGLLEGCVSNVWLLDCLEVVEGLLFF